MQDLVRHMLEDAFLNALGEALPSEPTMDYAQAEAVLQAAWRVARAKFVAGIVGAYSEIEQERRDTGADWTVDERARK